MLGGQAVAVDLRVVPLLLACLPTGTADVWVEALPPALRDLELLRETDLLGGMPGAASHGPITGEEEEEERTASQAGRQHDCDAGAS